MILIFASGKLVCTGEFVSMANHCDDNAPYGNSFTTELTGNIITQDNDDKHHEEHD